MTKKHEHLLSRIEIRRYHDKPTNSICLKYVGTRLSFHDSVYGFPEGVFFVCSIDDMPFPPKLIEVSDAAGIPIEATDVSKQVRLAAVDSLVSEAMVKAPQMLAEFAEPDCRWAPWDQRELERQHVIALSRLVELTSICEREIRLRSMKVSMDPGMPTVLPHAPMPSLYRPDPVVEVVKATEREVVEESVPVQESRSDSLAARVAQAIVSARESELPQRLPQGARRALAKMVRAAYLIKGEDQPSVRGDILEAMRDGEKLAASDKVEVTVVDWDGEWPVVVRRYGPGGRTVYRVEEALRRAGVEEKAA